MLFEIRLLRPLDTAANCIIKTLRTIPNCAKTWAIFLHISSFDVIVFTSLHRNLEVNSCSSTF